MKKNISTFCFTALVLLSSLGFSQKNLTLILRGEVNDAFFKKTEFSYILSAPNVQEAAAFIEKAKLNADIASIKNTGKDAAGNFQVLMLMKQAHDKDYYLKLVMNLGADYIQVTEKGEKKTPRELLREDSHNHEEHSTKPE